MKIGIDAKWYFNGPVSGKVVVKNLVDQILKLNDSNEYYIILKSEKNIQFPKQSEKVHLLFVNSYNNLLTNVFILPKLAKKHKLDVVLFQNFSPIFHSFKAICYVHDVLFLDFPKYYSFKELLYLFPISFLSKRADAVITISKTELNRIINHKITKKNKISFVYHGVSNLFKPLRYQNHLIIKRIIKKYKLPDQFILFLGRINSRKNIEVIIKSLPLITPKIPLVIAGKKDRKVNDFTSLIKQLNIEDRIVFTGFVDDHDIPLLYSCATIFCFPSFAEGFGLPPLEAMASGVPVVTSNATCLPEICQDAALYADPHKPEEFAQKINEVLRDEKLKQKLIKNGLERSREFQWSNSAIEIIKIIEKINEAR